MNYAYISNVDNHALLGASDWGLKNLLQHPRCYVPIPAAMVEIVFPGFTDWEAKYEKVSAMWAVLGYGCK
jgi:hypothetical protein